MKIGMFSAAAGLLLTPGVAFAQADPGFEVGVDAFDYDYSEKLDGRTIVKDRGIFVGLTLAYVETLRDGWSLKANARGANADVDYRSEDGATIDDVPQNLASFELTVTRDIEIGSDVFISPSIGLGGRLLTDESGRFTDSNGAAGYDREIYYSYIPVGFSIDAPLGTTRVAASMCYAFLIDGEVQSKLSTVDALLPDVTSELDGGHLLEAGIDVKFPVGNHRLIVGPFVRSWSVDRSSSVIVDIPGAQIEFFEPRSRTIEAGARIAFAF